MQCHVGEWAFIATSSSSSSRSMSADSLTGAFFGALAGLLVRDLAACPEFRVECDGLRRCDVATVRVCTGACVWVGGLEVWDAVGVQ